MSESDSPDPKRRTRRAVIGTLAAAAVATPIAFSEMATATPRSTLNGAPAARTGNTPSKTHPSPTPTATAGKTASPSPTASATAPTNTPPPLWHPIPAKDGLKAFEGVEFDRKDLFPSRHADYIYVEDDDHYRFNIWADDRDSTGDDDRQRTEAKGMVQNGVTEKWGNGQTWTISYEMYMPSTLHGTSRFTHISQTKIHNTDDGPYVTLDLTRESATSQTLRARAYANPGSPTIASTPLQPLWNTWITIQWKLTIGTAGTAEFTCINSAGKTVANGSMKNVVMFGPGADYLRPKWGIYRSVESAPADILDTYLLIRDYQSTRLD